MPVVSALCCNQVENMVLSVRKLLMGVFAFIVVNAANAAAPDFKAVEEQVRQSEKTLSVEIGQQVFRALSKTEVQ